MAKPLKTIARPYAQAVVLYALEEGTWDRWHIFLRNATQMALDSQVAYLLDHPGVASEQLLELFFSVLEQEVLDEHHRDFLHLLALRRRLSLLPEIRELFQQFYAEKQDMLDVQVISSFDLTEDQRERLAGALKARFHKKQIVFTCVVDPTILGGAIIRAGDFVIDGSGKGKLDQLKRCLQNEEASFK